MSFGTIMWNQNMKEKQNYVTFKYIYVDITKDVENRFDI